MTTPIYFYKADSLSNLKPDSLVALKLTGGLDFSLWVTDKNGLPYPLKDNTGGGGGTIEAIINTDGNLTITGTTTKTINVSSSLLLLINSALQAGDNISDLVNDANYITLADIPAFVASDYDLEDFTNAGADPYAHLSDLSVGATNLSYTASPTNGVVTSDTGDDATIPLADNTNAGLLSSAEKAYIATALQPSDISGKVPYTGATTDVDLGEHQLKTGQLELDQTPTGTFSTAKIRWNDTAGTAEMRLKGDNVTLQIGQELVKRVVNKTTTNITLQESNYQVVRIIGATGQRLSVDLAQADSETNSASTLGLVTENIANNQEGFITFSGEINLINTTGSLQGETWMDGDVLYLSPTIAGQLTNIEPIAPDRKIRVGYVQHTHATQGKIHVDVDRGYSLENLHNVKITATTAGKILGSTTEGLWENKTIAEILGYTPVNPILNINTTSPLLGGGNLTTDRTLSIQQSTGIQNGYLSSTDWNTFNSKQPALGFTPENVANKSDSYTASSSTAYVSGKALVEGLGTKQNTLTNPVTGTFVAGRVPYSSSNSTLTDSSKLLWNNTNSYFEVNGNAPRFTLKNNLNNFSTYFTNNANGTLILKNHQDKTLTVFSNPVNSTEQPQMAIGKVSSIPVESQLYVYGGMNGANIDARGSIDRDEANIDLEGNDWETSPNSLGFSYFGSSSTAVGDILGYAKTKLGVIRFQDTNYAIINSDKSTGISPIRFGINQIEIGNVNDKGFSYQSDFSSVNSSNPRWLTDKAYVDTKIPLSEKGATNGVATLGSDGKVPNSQIPALTTANITDSAEKRYQTDNQKLFNDATSSIQTQLNGKEKSFAKNTAFNKNFGTTAGSVVEGGTLGSNAYSSTAYLPLSGGTLTGALNGTSATFSSSVTAKGGMNLVSNNVNEDNVSYTITNTAASKIYSFTTGKQGITHNGVGIWNRTDNTRPIWFEDNGAATFSSTVTAISFNGSATLTGTPTAPTAAPGTTGNQIATLDYVLANSGATSGTYTPTLTNTNNISSSALVNATYMRIGDIVQGTVGFLMTPTASGVGQLTFTLPVGRSISTLYYIGTGSFLDALSAGKVFAQVQTTATNSATVNFTVPNTNVLKGSVSFQYNIN